MASEVPTVLFGQQKEGRTVGNNESKQTSLRKTLLDAIDSLILFGHILDLEPIQNLKGLLVMSGTQANQTRQAAQFVESLIRSVENLPLVPGLSLWQNFLANLTLSLGSPVITHLIEDPQETGNCVLHEILDRDITVLASMFMFDKRLVTDRACDAAFLPVNCSGVTRLESRTPVLSIRKELLSDIADPVLRNACSLELKETLRNVLRKANKLIGPGPLGMSHVLAWNPPSTTLSEPLRIDACLSYLTPVMDFDPVSFDDLIGYEQQKQVVIQNTRQLVAGAPANNILLYGDRGTGKSSMVKATALMFAREGIRLIEVKKDRFRDIPALSEAIGSLPLKFIIFVDDLSFEEYETEYKYMKALLEGGVQSQPDNVVLYATSNRRHLVAEKFSDVDDIHHRDTAEEKLSLSDRFGITLTFTAPSQQEYLRIVRALADKSGLDIDRSELERKALRWAMRGNGMSGRTARQFIRDLVGRLSQECASADC